MRSVRGSSKGWQALNSKKKNKPAYKPMPCYVKRNERLSNLGYVAYQKYLQSEDWQRIRCRKLQRYPTCLLCNNPASCVHHMSYDYETLLGLKDYKLVQLCNDCHHSIEFNGDHKRHLKDANRRLFELAVQTGLGRSWMIYVEAEKGKHKAKQRRAKRNAKR